MGLKIIFFNKLDFTLLSKNLVRNRNKFGAKSLQIWCEIVIIWCEIVTFWCEIVTLALLTANSDCLVLATHF